MKRPKKKSPTWYRKKCVDWAIKEAKKRDNYISQKSGIRLEGFNCHGSHILPEGSYPLMSAEPYNIITLSFSEHILWWHKNPLEAAEWFEKKWPGRKKELLKMDKEKRTHVVNWEKRYEEIKTL